MVTILSSVLLRGSRKTLWRHGAELLIGGRSCSAVGISSIPWNETVQSRFS